MDKENKVIYDDLKQVADELGKVMRLRKEVLIKLSQDLGKAFNNSFKQESKEMEKPKPSKIRIEQDNVSWGEWIIFVLLTIVLLTCGFGIGHGVPNKASYKRGQIDALSGNIKYELIEHEDKTKSWEKIK